MVTVQIIDSLFLPSVAPLPLSPSCRERQISTEPVDDALELAAYRLDNVGWQKEAAVVL